MKVLIETKNLIDFPYSPNSSSIFHFDNDKVEGLVSEILYASPTCYLVSGYRGSGKTSFLKRVEERCREEKSKNGNGHKLIFVHSNFSRFENRTNFLRKVIRDLQETVAGAEKDSNGNIINELEDLKRKTFYAVKEEHVKSTENELITEFSLDLNDFIKKMLKGLMPLLLPFLSAPPFYISPKQLNT